MPTVCAPSAPAIKYKEITDRYNYSLDHKSNIVLLEGHRGRHTNAYHEFMLFAITQLDILAPGDLAVFIDGMWVINGFILDNPQLPYAKGN